MTIFAEILRGCGLSLREAAAFLAVSKSTIDSMSSGRRAVPPGVLAELHELAARQDQAALEAVDIWEQQGRPSEIEIGLASDGYEAQSLGWPCVGAHRAVIRRIWEMLPGDVRLIVVPRGTTQATAAAADARERRP